MNKDEHYDVVDECMGEKMPETFENTSAKDVEDTCPKLDSTMQQQDPETNTGMLEMQLKCCI